MTPEDILMQVFDTDLDELQLAITLNPSLDRILEAMNMNTIQEIIAFENWRQGPYCLYTPSGENNWQHVIRIREFVTTQDLYCIFKDDKHNKNGK